MQWKQLGALCLAISFASGAAGADPDPSERKTGWIRVETEHFTLLSDAGKRRAVTLGKKLEQLREVLIETSTGMSVNSPLPTTIYVFKNTKSFDRFNIGENGKPNNISGYFVRSLDGNYVALDSSATVLPFAVIYHEYLHYVLENSIPGIPLWLTEGIAEFYSTFTIFGGRAEIGRAIPEHLTWLSRHEWMPLQELFEVDSSSPDYSEGERQGTFYAQSWFLAHHLLVDPQRRKSAGQFMTLLGQGMSSAAAFESAFGIDVPTAEKQLREYLRTGSNTFFRYTPQEAFDEQSAEATALSHRDVQYYLADLLTHHTPIQYEDTEKLLAEVLDLDETFVDAYATLAMVRLRQERPKEAAELCEKALTLDPKHERALILRGTALMEQFRSSFDESGPVPETTPPIVLEARTLYGTLLTQQPGHFDALAGFGSTYYFDREHLKAGIDSLARAFQMRPSRTDLLAELVVLTARSGNVEGALSLLDRVLRPRGDAETTRWVESEVTRTRMDNVYELVEGGDIDGALGLAREIVAGVSNVEVQRSLGEWIDKLSVEKATVQLRDEAMRASEAGDAEKARELLEQAAAAEGDSGPEDSARHNYNLAVTLAQEGRHDEAAELFEKVAESTSQSEMKAAASEHALELRKLSSHNRSVDLYNQAIDAIGAGKLEKASSLLDELLADPPGGELEQEARAVKQELERRKP